MDLTTLLPTIGVVVGALATLGGVAITAHSNRKADEKRLALEEARETNRLAREDDTERRVAEDERNRRQLAIYDQIAQLFVGELSTVRAQVVADPELRSQKFDQWFDAEWPVQADMRLRRVIAGVTNDDHRLRVTQILDAVNDHINVAFLYWVESSEQIEVLLTLGFDLASTYARGQEPGEDLQNRWAAFRKQVAEADAWKERERQEQRDKWAQEAKEREEAKKANDNEPF